METDISGEVRVVAAAVGILHPDSLIYRNLLSLNPFYERPGVCGRGWKSGGCSCESPSETVRTEAGVSGALSIVQMCV